MKPPWKHGSSPQWIEILDSTGKVECREDCFDHYAFLLCSPRPRNDGVPPEQISCGFRDGVNASCGAIRKRM